MRLRVGAVLVAVAVAMAAPAVSALTVPVIGGPGLDQGQWCVANTLCPGTPVATLTGSAAVSGSVTYNPGPGTVDITLTLLQNADFGSPARRILSGSTFTATGVPVLSLPLGGGAFQVVQIGGATGSAFPIAAIFDGPTSPLANTPAVSGLTCTFGTGSDQCGVSFGASGLRFNTVSGQRDLFVTFNVNVPEPGTLAALGLGLAGLGLFARRPVA